MKVKLLALISLFAIGFSACEDDNVNPTNGNNNQSFTGNLNIKVLDPSNNVVSGTTVFLYRTLDDLKNNFTLNTRSTASNGKADFGQIFEGFYYARTGRWILNEWYADTIAVQILTDQNTNREMYLHK